LEKRVFFFPTLGTGCAGFQGFAVFTQNTFQALEILSEKFPSIGKLN